MPELLGVAKEGKLEEVKALIRAGADVNVRGEFGITPLMMAARFNSGEVVKALLEAGADVNARDDFGETALMGAALNKGNPGAAEALVRAGADVFVRNYVGISAIDYAGNNDEIKRIILNATK